ncbi:unnamed protein product, partial [marine sediment metagenome]
MGHKIPYDYEKWTLELDIAIPEIESISGGIGVSASIKNVGTATATDIPWSID